MLSFGVSWVVLWLSPYITASFCYSLAETHLCDEWELLGRLVGQVAKQQVQAPTALQPTALPMVTADKGPWGQHDITITVG